MSFTALVAVAVLGQVLAHYVIAAVNGSFTWSLAYRPEGAERTRNDLALILFVNLTAIQLGWVILGLASNQKLSWRGVEFFTVMLALSASVLCWRIAAAQRPMTFWARCVWLAIMFGLLKSMI
jgi:hypothetical protein